MAAGDELASKTKFNVIVNFVRGLTVLMSLFPIGYGILTFVFGDALWGSGEEPIYEAALRIPWAPQSWGAFAATCGVMILIAEFREKHVLLSGSCFLQGLWCFVLGAYFIRDVLNTGNPIGAPRALLLIAIGVAYFLRSRLAWIWS